MKVIRTLKFDQSARIAIHVNRKIQFMTVSQILYCKSERNYTAITTIDGDHYMVTRNLTFVRKQLEPFGFILIHKSWLINANYVEGLQMDKEMSIILKNNKEFKVARRKKSSLRKTFSV